MIQLVIVLAVIGFLVYLLTTYIPMAPIFRTVIYVVVAIVLILYLLRVFGVGDIPVPRL